MSLIVETSAGKVEGLQQDGLKIFKGIPYAAPPIGDRRWLPPQPAEAWTGVRQARSFGNVAPQNRLPPEATALLSVFDIAEPQSEDCLYLNVWSPGLDDARRPVIVWIHGGGFTIGASSQELYEGSTLAKRGDVVFVSINYRLGPFGYLNLNDVTGGMIPATGNEGMLDQIAALEWVRDNIAAFGGDPGNVTIFGESAGGMSVGVLLGMPRARGLFHKAICQSGVNQGLKLDRAAIIAERFISVLGLDASDVDGLRSSTMQQWLAAAAELGVLPSPPRDPKIGGMPLQPVVDGKLLPVLPLDAVANGSADGVIVMAGSNLEESKLFGLMDPGLATLDEASLMERICRTISTGDAKVLVKGYRQARTKRGAPTTPAELFGAIQTDQIFRIPAVRLTEALHLRNQSAYNYLFTWRSPALGGMFGACHGLEIGFVFGTHTMNEGMASFSGSGPAADALAEKMQDAWLAFARMGDPSCDSLGSWPTYGDKRETMILGEECGIEEAPYDEERRAWESVPNSVVTYL